MRMSILGTIFLMATSAFAGPLTSGGGFAVVCRNDNDQITKSELLDLFEAKNKFKYELIESTGSLEGDFIASVQNTYRLQGYANAAIIGSDLRIKLDDFLKSLVFLPKGEKLPNLNDLGDHLKAPAGCKIEPLAVGNDEKKEIKVDAEIWETLSTLDQAALLQHELAYHFERGLYEKNSIGARNFVAAVFSTNATPALTEKTKALPEAMATFKVNDKENIYTTFRHETNGNVMKMHFSTIMDRAVITNAVAAIDLTGIKLQSTFMKVIALTDKPKKIKVAIQNEQRQDWEIEFTFVPNQPVKIEFIQKGVLLQEAILNHL